MNMVNTVDNLRSLLPALVSQHSGHLEVVEAVCSGRLAREQLQSIAARMHAEIRAAIQIKIPERLRICPIEAGAIRRYWYHQLAEESGEFELGQDHASLFLPVCLALGVTSDQLSAEYDQYLPSVNYLRESPVSLELSLRELAQMYVEEAVLAAQAIRISDALRDRYGVPQGELRYFQLHAALDVEHSAAGLDALVRCTTSDAQQRLVLETAERVLNQFPTWITDVS